MRRGLAKPRYRAPTWERAGALWGAIAEALFDPDEGAHGPSRRWGARYLAVAVLVAAVLAARRPDVVTNPQFWGEDAFTFFHDQLVLGFVGALANFYAGFPQLAQRLVALLGSFVPFTSAPRVYTMVTLATTAFGLASFALPAFRHIVRSDAVRMLWCVGAACLPFEQQMPPIQWGGGVGTPANLGWWLAVWLALLSVIRLPRQGWRIALLALAGAVAIFSTPLAPIFAPLWALRAWHGRRRGRGNEIAFSLVLLGAQTLCFAITQRLGANVTIEYFRGFGVYVSFLDHPWVYLAAYLGFLSDRIAAFGLAPDALAVVRTTGAGAVAALAVAVMAALAAAARAGRRGTMARLATALYVCAAALLVTVLGRLLWTIYPPQDLPARYTLLPGAMLLLAVAIALDGLPTGWTRRVLLAGAVAVIGWSFSPRFAVMPFKDQRWPKHARLLEQRLRTGSPEPLVIPINPPWSRLEFAPGELAGDRAASAPKLREDGTPR